MLKKASVLLSKSARRNGRINEATLRSRSKRPVTGSRCRSCFPSSLCQKNGIAELNSGRSGVGEVLPPEQAVAEVVAI
jgi:hypothetical protein